MLRRYNTAFDYLELRLHSSPVLEVGVKKIILQDWKMREKKIQYEKGILK